ncbi:dihydroxy-acid dehydratase [Nonomuraea wenchangensis]|uniref:dihydroxy-acid dehydratase domain-containing protein n=1 Tax=Nonomuraea wenchangensis TaxID=568860 RepID=UPI00344823DD
MTRTRTVSSDLWVSYGQAYLVADGDLITIDIPARTLHLQVSEQGLAARRVEREGSGYRPRRPQRPVSTALRAYAALAQSAAKGAVRALPSDQCVWTRA